MNGPRIPTRWPKRWMALCCAVTLYIFPHGVARAQQPATIHASAYNMDVTLDPAKHSIHARVAVTFTASGALDSVSFALNPKIHDIHVLDSSGQVLIASRSPDNASRLRVTPAITLPSHQEVTWIFQYTATFAPESTSFETQNPQAGMASIGDPVSYLLYGARWFPVSGYRTDRFTATIHVHVPIGERVFGSGEVGTPDADNNARTTFDFVWSQPGFPGTIIAGKFHDADLADGNPDVHLFRIDEKAGPTPMQGKEYATAAAEEYAHFVARFGPLDEKRLNVIELPEGAAPAYSGPGLIAIAQPQLMGRNSSRLLANTIAHQWWGDQVSPAAIDDSWITNGMCRYAELEYLNHSTPPAVFSDAVLNVSAGALAYDSVQLSDAGHYAVDSPAFQALTYDKGAMVFRMLRWQIGDIAFERTLREILAQKNRSVSADEVEKFAETSSGQDLRPFFIQWLDNTGTPTLRDDWTLYRLGGNKGFRTVGEITQDLDLFHMPVEVRIVTDSKTVIQRVDVSGPQTQFVIETSDIPRKISLDPDRLLLRSDPDMQVRVHVLRGQQMAAQNNFSAAVQEYRQALAIDDVSSLASFRLGEVYFKEHNYQTAAQAFRDSLHGDDEPKWTEVWSDLELGKIFDASGQRERAVNQYRETLQTGDDTGNALELARSYIEHPYQPEGQPAR